jgi:hypothetical protein
MCAYRVSFSEQLENANGATGSCDSEVLPPAMIKTVDQSIYQSIKKPKQTNLLLKRREFFTAKKSEKR